MHLLVELADINKLLKSQKGIRLIKSCHGFVKDTEYESSGEDMLEKFDLARQARNSLIHDIPEAVQPCFYPRVKAKCKTTFEEEFRSIANKAEDIAAADYDFNAIMWSINEEPYYPRPFSEADYKKQIVSWILSDVIAEGYLEELGYE